MVRTILIFIVGGALLGIVLSSFAAPSILATGLCGFETTAQANKPCLTTVNEATAGLIRYQLYGGAGFGVVGIMLGIAFTVWRKRRVSSAQPG